MVPSAWVTLGRLPLTPNGKVDLRALPAPEEVQEGEKKELARARTPTQELVAAIWSEVLGVEEVGVDSDFFELGGHSLIATRVVSRVRERLGGELPLRVFFREPTVEGVAAQIDVAIRTEAGVEAPSIEPTPREGDLPLSFAQQRLWFIDQLEPDSPFYNAPFMLRLVGGLDVAALRRTLLRLVDRHEVLRTTFADRDGSPFQVISPSPSLPLPVVDLSALDEERRGRAE